MPDFDQSVSWSDDELGSTNKLNTMAQNDNILYNMMPHFLYRRGVATAIDFSESQSTVLKPVMIAGYVGLDIANRYGQTRTITFPTGTFGAGCAPVVMTQVAALGHERYVMSTISGTDGSRNPRSDGFRVQIYHRDGERFKSNVTVHYVAFGWQEA